MESSYLKKKYMLDILSETGKLRVKPCSSSMVPSIHPAREGEAFEDPE